MATVITLTWQQTYGYVDFTVTGAAANTTLYRLDVIDPTQLVPLVGYESAAWINGGVGLGQDYRAPIGETVTYVVAAVGATVDTPSNPRASVAIPGNQAWLRDVANPNLSTQVNVITTGTESRRAYQTVYQVAGRSLPLVVHDARQARSGTVELLVPDRAARVKLDKLLATGNPLLLNVCSDLLWTPCYMAIGDAAYTRISKKDSWTLSLDYNEVDQPTTIYAGPSSTRQLWQGVKDRHTTWQAVKDFNYPDWLHVALGTP